MRRPAWSSFSFFPLLALLAQVHGDCTTPPKQPHATLRNGELKDSYSVGTVLRYTCIPGYKFIDRSNPSIMCLNNSEWSTTPTFCERKQCKAPAVENGRIESTGDLRLGEEITYVCDPGYRAIGRTTARCTLFEGNKVLWDNDPPLCERIPCERPPTILNGTHSGDTSLDHYTVGDVVTYSCGRDLSLIGHSSIVCIIAEDGVNGKWDRPAPECKAVQCSRPQIQNGRLTSAFQPIYNHEHVLQFVCDSGYSLVGPEFVKCGADSMWHPELPTCVKVVECSRPQIQNGKLTTGIQPSYPYKHVLQFVCDSGYSLVGPEFVKCGADSMWHPELPTCVKVVECSRPQIQNGKLTTGIQPSYPYEHVLQFVCDSGYTMVGNESVKCGADSMWHPELPTCVKVVECSRPQIQNGKLTTGIQPSYPYDHVLQFVCDSGYTMVGNESVKCGADSMWHPELPTCVKVVECSRPQIQNGKLTTGFQPSYPYEHVLQFVCDSGYSLVGNEFVKCGADSMWHPELPTCVKVVRCIRPQIQNGKLTTGFLPSYSYAHVLQFICNDGYTLVGNDLVKCGADSMWHPELPTCVKEQPETSTTEETVTKEPGATGETVPTDDSGNKMVGIVVGVFVGVLVLAAVIFGLTKWKPCLKKGKSSSHSNSTDTYNPVPRKDIVLEEKSRP